MTEEKKKENKKQQKRYKEKPFGLFYTTGDGMKYLFHSYYNIESLQKGIESKEFQAIEKKEVVIVKLEEPKKSSKKESKEDKNENNS